METKIDISSYSLFGLLIPVIEILLVFVFICALIPVLDFFKIKYGIKNKSETIDIDLWLFTRFLFQYAGFGIIAGCLGVILFAFIDEYFEFQLSPYSFLMYSGILILFISKGLGRYITECEKKKV